MNLHNEIMNIPIGTVVYDEFSNKVIAYKSGHRDARHKASELSLKLMERVEALEEMLRWYVEEDEINEYDPENKYWIEGKHKAMELLAVPVKARLEIE